MKYRNDYRINVLFCGFTKVELNCISLVVNDNSDLEGDIKYRKNPHLIYINKLEEAFKHKGFALIMKVDKDFDPLEFDKKYRRKLDYWYIFYYNDDYEESIEFSKYNGMIQMSPMWLYSDWYDGFINEIDEYFRKHQKKKIQEARKKKIEEMHKYIKPKHEMSSKEISEKFNISIRNVERYMNDMNYLYNDVGYDYSKNIWYIVK